MNKENLTPMMRQYFKIKEEYKDYVLFYRLGDFYELFYEEAEVISKQLELALTARAGVPMCGVPYHSAESYIRRLIKQGYKVALCEQIGEASPNPKVPMQRDVVRLITPGTLTEDSMLDSSKNNYAAAFYAFSETGETKKIGAAFGDVSSGELHVFSVCSEPELVGLIARFMPSEVMFNPAFMDFKNATEVLKTRVNCLAEVAEDEKFLIDEALIERQLKTAGKSSREILESENAAKALTALLKYVEYTQKTSSPRFTSAVCEDLEKTANQSEYLEIGITANRNLELTESARGKEKAGTLLGVLDCAKTAMGKRRLRKLIQRPFKRQVLIIKRLDALEEIKNDPQLLSELRAGLSGIFDLERLVSRIVFKTSSPRDVSALGNASAKLPQIKEMLNALSSPLMLELNASMDDLKEIANLIMNAIVPEPPVNCKDGGYINFEFNPELKRLKSLTDGGKDLLYEIERREKESLGVKNLKIGFNRVFGYYIEIPRSASSDVPEHYHRRQTVANSERFVTEELKKIEEDILTAKEKSVKLEAEIFEEIKNFIEASLEKIQRTAEAVADLDVICALAEVALRENYCRPDIALDGVIDLKASRHPVVEKTLTGGAFAPNDCYLDTKSNRFMVITGPNMSGKSTYMRQVALIVVMAQMGSFVPAKSARIGVVDKIFTRVGASDDLSMGRSTFMVEMLEVAEILENATRESFVILDEIGRGTSTFDGISIAKATAEYINNKIGCKTLFATHYHELAELASRCNGIKNLSVGAVLRDGEISFLHKVSEGGTNRSYGVEVAKLAGLPSAVISSARKTLKQMELNSKIELEEKLREADEKQENKQVGFELIARENAINRIKSADLENLTPMEALRTLAEIKEELL